MEEFAHINGWDSDEAERVSSKASSRVSTPVNEAANPKGDVDTTKVMQSPHWCIGRERERPWKDDLHGVYIEAVLGVG